MPTAEPIPTISGRGGARPGAGRPKKSPDAPATATQTANSRYAEARAQYEVAKVEKANRENKVAAGELVLRAAVQDASARMFHHLAQGLRGIPDNLERAGLPAEWLECVENAIDAGLAQVADDLQVLGGQGA